MENRDRELLVSILPYRPELKKLYDEHLKLEKEVERFQRYASYSPSAALRSRELKKRKLHGMDQIMTILDEHRGTEHFQLAANS